MRSRTPTELRRLSELHPDLQAIITEAQKTVAFYIVCGYRNKLDQDKAFAGGFSKAKWPQSPHNKVPSDAVDLCPNKAGPADWKDLKGFELIYRAMLEAAKLLNIPIRAGADFKTFRDAPHFERVV